MDFLKKVFKSLWGKKEQAPPEVVSPEPPASGPAAPAAPERITVARRPADVRVAPAERREEEKAPVVVEVSEKPEPSVTVVVAASPAKAPAATDPTPVEVMAEDEQAEKEAGVIQATSLFEDEEWDDFDSAFDRAFGMAPPNPVEEAAILLTAGPSTEIQPIATASNDDYMGVQDLFAEIAANYARPIKSFIHELMRGPVIMDWIDICRPALETIRKAAEKMEFEVAAKCMNDFSEALSLAANREERLISEEHRDLILAIFEEMVRVLPKTFTIREEEHLREAIIINSLLKQIPEVGRVTMDKLYGVGLTSLDAMFNARPEDLAVTTAIPMWLCEKICVKFNQFKYEIDDSTGEEAQSVLNRRLGTLLAELKRQHEGYEKAAEMEWTQPEFAQQKKQFRQGRQEAALQINIVLAEMEEFELVDSIQKMPFDERIRVLLELLSSRGADAEGEPKE